MMAIAISFQARIIAELSAAVKKLQNPDSRHNEGAYLGEAFLWDTIADYAAKRSKDAWKEMEVEDVIKDDETLHNLQPGEYILSESTRFVCKAIVTRPVQRFSPEILAKALNKQFKIPEPTTIKLVESSKKPTRSQVKIAVTEKGSV